MIVGFGILVGWVCQVSGPQELALVEHRLKSSPAAFPIEQNRFLSPGLATSLIAGGPIRTAPRSASIRIALGRRYDLAAGLMEIVYDSGPGSSFKGLARIP